MERTAPLNNAAKIKTPLLLIQGQNDPRVPVTEANALFQATKGRIPVWYLRARDEGHGFVNPENRNYRLYALIRFVQEYLLPTTINPSPTLQPRSSTAGNSGGKQ
jgi:dipeptidyl aminopeptidase/acylaminoacyl peptidase